MSILEDWKTTGKYEKAWGDGNKPRGKLDVSLENVIGIIIILKITKGELMYGTGICSNLERYTWNKTYYYY